MSIIERIEARAHEFPLVPKKHLFELNCKIRDSREGKKQRNPITDFGDSEDFEDSEFKAPGIKHCSFKEDNGTRSWIVFEPHNFPEVCHLNLAESTFIHEFFKYDEEEPCLDLTGLIGLLAPDKFHEKCKLKIAAELLRHIAEIPHSVSRLMKSFLKFARISECITWDEMPPVSKLLFEAMYLQTQESGADGNLIVEILKTFSSSQELKRCMMVGGYSHEILDYIFRCCSAVKFDIENYLINGYVKFCPLTKCITSVQHDFRILRIALQYGFEIHGDILRKDGRSFADGMLIDWRNQLYEDPLMQLSSHRQNILLFFQHIAYASSKLPPWEWVDSVKLVFNSIPDPYICKHELRLYKSHSFRLFVLTHLKGSYTTSYSPRTIKHLSRCVIKKVLKLNFELPNGISALPLPPALQCYLKNLED